MLVFTGTAGTANPVSADAANAIKALGTTNNFTVDTTAAATDINATKLAGYRAVVFVNSSGDVLDTAGESALQSYVQNGGGFVGIGETALLEQGNAFFDQLIGLTGAARTAGAATTSSQDVEFLDRVHPATKALPLLKKDYTDSWYSWTNNPTGNVHTVARVRFNRVPDGSTVTNDAVTRFTGTTNTNQPQLERPVSWCRDIQSGRSFYTGLGGTTAAWSDSDITGHILGAIQWASGMTRGNCKATITSNYRTTRLTPPNPTTTSNAYVGEIDGMSIAKDGRVFYAGRAVCSQGQSQINNWATTNVALGCGTLHVWDPSTPGAGTENQDPAKVTKIGELQVFGAKGGGQETGATSKTEQGILGISLDPDFTNGRPYIYIQYHPYFGGEQGYPVGSMQGGAKSFGPGFVRPDYMGERRLSRFTYDNATKSLVPGSEKVILHWMTQVFSCCHLGGSMDFDSKGNLYFATGDNTGNTPNATNGGYQNSDPTFTVPCPGTPTNVYTATGCGITQPCADKTVGGEARCGHISYGDARQTSGNTNAYEGKLLRIHPMADPGDTPGIGTTYTIPDASAPNGPQLFPPDSQAVKDGKAKPEVFAMGTRNLYSIDVDSKTDKVATAWVGPDQGTDSTTYGTSKTENAALLGAAGNYGWPYCQGGNRLNYRAKLPNPSASNGGAGANLSDNIRGTVGGGADGQTGAYWDCSKSLPNDSPYNTGLTDIPAPKPTNIWYGQNGGCTNYQRNANGVIVVPANSNTTAAPAVYRECPFAFGGSQAPMTAGIYRKPAGSAPNAWPAYWDGRWFLSDFAGANNIRHALLMDPANDTKGGLPISADSLYGIIPTSLFGANRTIDLDFGPDGDLYVASYSGSNFTISNNNTGLWKFSYVGGDDTPGPDPQAATTTSTMVNFNIGKSGGISYAWTFDDGGTATGATASHIYKTGGTHKATLTVTYADNTTSSKDVTVEVPPTVSTTIGATVTPTLSLVLGATAPGFGQFVAGVAKTYDAQTTADIVSTAGNATLTVSDIGTIAPGHLVNGNGTSVLAQAIKARATNVANPSTTFADVSANPLTLLTYPMEISHDAVTLQFQQPIAANDALRSGSYSKTLTFTLSTTAP
ncbi:ThuA domain-containing protein [Solirubrobacter ginsenosidimutans]|uniref:ThuA domain-containing protein n=1 Tax=Solirubrobacter ginsenosidimutans TaxID=490573 RepID=A0A9X3MRM8_9ACTN|nr:ThuA domain-containing protein [Solirubrobacter ginsenosidimutans]